MPLNISYLFLIRLESLFELLLPPKHHSLSPSVPEVRSRNMEPPQEMQTLDSTNAPPKAGIPKMHDKDTLALAKTGKRQVLQV